MRRCTSHTCGRRWLQRSSLCPWCGGEGVWSPTPGVGQALLRFYGPQPAPQAPEAPQQLAGQLALPFPPPRPAQRRLGLSLFDRAAALATAAIVSTAVATWAAELVRVLL